VVISALKLLWGFPVPILLALLVNELTSQSFKKTVQTISYLPHFMSWIILATILREILSPQSGPIAQIAVWMGQPPPEVLTTGSLFRPMLIVTEIWKEMGWQSVIYLAALASIDPELYESATVDGANRVQRSVHITLPSLLPVITILAILRIGNLLNAGFDQIFNLYNPLVYEVADIIDTFVYRRAFAGEGGLNQYDYAAAVGLFKSVMAVLLILGTHKVARRLTGQGVW
jgi:putative aldouronate transport system permease protein